MGSAHPHRGRLPREPAAHRRPRCGALAAAALALVFLTAGAHCAPDSAGSTPTNFAANVVVRGPQNASGSHGAPHVVTDGRVDDYGPHHGYAWAYLDTPLLVDLGAPQRVGAIEMLLLDTDARSYRYRVETSLDGQTWQPATDLSSRPQRAWQRIAFTPRPCRLIRVTFTATTLSTNSYHVVELAAYAAPPPGDSALFRQWRRARGARALAATDAIGVTEAADLLADPQVRERLRRLTPGDCRGVDRDGDGRPELIAFADGRHLIVALDDDGDADFARLAPDEDSDCLAVDYGGDGTIDRVLDRVDVDGDGDADQLHLYYLGGGFFGSRHGLVVVWDYDDDNEMWHLIDYQYNQGGCQWQCDFGGDEAFSMFHAGAKPGEWVGAWENPFCFYDPDGDGAPEVAVRYEGRGEQIRAVRYSLNADNDRSPPRGYDYDVAVITLGPATIPAAEMVTAPLRHGATGPFVPWHSARRVAQAMSWKRALLVWDENDHNVAPGDSHERWEGLINSAYHEFPQIGGPPCGRVNKRYELDADCSGDWRLYFSSVDRRFHLFGAERGTYQIDADGDGRLERIIDTTDTDGDGFFDRWAFDDDADGQPDRTVAVDGRGPLRPMAYEGLPESYVPRLAEAYADCVALVAALGGDTTGAPRQPERLERSRFEWENRCRALLASQIEGARDAAQQTRLDRLTTARDALDRGRWQDALDALDALRP